MPTALYVLGTSYCGSSVVNALLGAHPQIAAMGELLHLANGSETQPCSRCRTSVSHCRTYKHIRQHAPAELYQELWQLWGKPVVIVNTSKWWDACFRLMPLPPPDWRIRVMVLSRPMHEFAFSFMQHGDGTFLCGCETWMTFYEFILQQLDRVEDALTRVFERVISPDDVIMVPYARAVTTGMLSLYTRSKGKLGLGLRDVDLLKSPWWEPRCCSFGGNAAMHAQYTDDAKYFEGSEKYHDKQRTLFVDAAWEQQPWIIEQCIDNIYPLFRWRLTRLLRVLGHPCYEHTLRMFQERAKQLV